ncbi:putative dna polymerase ii large subunit-like protein [Botrytis fragariae]|uniref:Putative dna polymerase ii large subunit-like protein n=1 Tax=Botrytis fragariae TaxID=1964551 RepID=A0A8H6AZ42_9HELO|nr:putative dna polymerase ii large subunit-like protein [Botrytis fragariae]KAF5876384.1 putative dna polymerase ii large subunit-like protein [Botrytis fragariae]
MANGKETKVSDNEGYLSDESDFYGDPETKASFEDRAADFDTTAYWKSHQPTLTEKADANVAQALANPESKATLYNPYAGQACAWQLDESIDDFLRRLPPRTTEISQSIPWIFVTNPFRKAPKGIAVNDEAPPSEHTDWARCVTEGNRLLDELITIRNTIERENSKKSTVAIDRMINKEKEIIVQKILDTAIDCGCTSGKACSWMIFSPSSEVDEIWAAIAKATSTNSLGISAKVAPNDGAGLLQKSRLICIYTEDFSDKMDVYRVLKAIRELGLVDRALKGAIYYKADVYTYLELSSHNPYDIKASLYNSFEFFKNPPLAPSTAAGLRSRTVKKENGKVDSFFRKIKKEPSDLAMRRVDYE